MGWFDYDMVWLCLYQPTTNFFFSQKEESIWLIFCVLELSTSIVIAYTAHPLHNDTYPDSQRPP